MGEPDFSKGTDANLFKNFILLFFSYRQNTRKKSALLRDQPLRPIDSAMFWIEHVLRHKGAEYLLTAAQDLHWVQLYLLDVILFTLAVILTFAVVIFKLLQKCFGKKKGAKKDTKKKKQ